MSYSSEVLADSPVVYWRQGDASGSTMTDSSGNSRHGTYAVPPTLGATGLLTGDADTAANFQGGGSGGYGEMASAAWMNVADLTVEAWIKPDQVTAQANIVIRDDGGGSRDWILRTTSAGKIDFAVWNTGGTLYQLIPATTLTAGNTYHIVATFDGTNQKVYLNGSQIGTQACTGDVRALSQAIQVGGPGSRFDGIIDEVAIYGTALSSTRASDHYNAGTAAGPTMSLAGDRPRTTGAFSLETVVDLSLAGERPRTTGDFAITVEDAANEVTLDGQRPRTTAAFTLDAGPFITLDGQRPRTTGDFSATVSQTLTLVGQRPRTVGAFSLAKPNETNRRNRVNGLSLSGRGIATYEPAVAEPAAFPTIVHNYEEARAFSAPTIVGARPVYTTTKVTQPRHRDRILVGGKDITYFRDVPTPTPSFRLIEPLDYGAGSLELPQINPAFEEYGEGDLAWLDEEKRVIVQRVDTETNEVVATDYRGFITAINVSGNTMVCELGGEVAGRAALMDRQPRLFRTVMDVARFVYGAVTRVAPVQFYPRLGPDTGIDLASRGGMSMLDYISELLALSTHTNGAQWTVGRRRADFNPDGGPVGTYGMWLKDRTTIHATVYLDDSRMVADVHNSLSEKPNRMFVTGITPDGLRFNFAALPGFKQGDPPPYPFAGGAPFGLGTTNDDCDNPEMTPIDAMLAHLVTMGFLTVADFSGAYDARAVRAVKRLQDQVGLAETGTMNPATWDALYDVSATNVSLTAARIEPAAQRPYVRPWHLSASGAKISRNPSYKRHRPKVDQSLNIGAGFTPQQGREYGRDRLGEASDPNWTGTLTAHLAFIEGEHNPGDPLTADMLMPPRAIRPGMNLWAPTFQGGTLFHVSGAEIPKGGRDPVFTIDTRARDTMAAWECITRNRESRHNPARAWLNQNRSSLVAKDEFTEWDAVSGLLDDAVRLAGGTWNIVPVRAGQGGTIQKIHIRTTGAETRFAVSVTARKITAARMNHIVPNPLTEAGTERWGKQWVRNILEDKGWVYHAGQFEQACGYFPGMQTGDDGEPTGDDITGNWEDDAGAGFHTGKLPFLYVAIWPEADCKIPAGYIMEIQREAGS